MARMLFLSSFSRRWLVLLIVAGGVLSASGLTRADSPEKPKSKTTARAKASKAGKKKPGQPIAPGVQTFTSDNFLVHTDLAEEASQELLTQLETMLDLISKYWGKPNARTIVMYVVKDINLWPQGVIPQQGLDHISSGGGVTISRTMHRTELTGEKTILAAEAVVYAIADRGTPQHEAVHAYCAQTFGRMGPTWYAEGMAEMGQYWRKDDASVNCDRHVVRYLKSEPPKSLTDITAPGQQTNDSWQNYAWRWALCHLLANNTNYAPRFRPLGLALLTNQDASFERVYGAMEREITFEYLFFLQHFDRGYRVDLCSWDWSTKFMTLKGSQSVQAKIDAGRGWQASRLNVKEDVTYEYSTTGQWKLDPDGEDVPAEGASDGRGKLVGVLFDDYELSEPIVLGESGEWTAPQSGKLFLRCQDGWCDLADNRGAIIVKWKLAK